MRSIEYKMMTYSDILLLRDNDLSCRRKSLIEKIYCNACDYEHTDLYKSLVQTVQEKSVLDSAF